MYNVDTKKNNGWANSDGSGCVGDSSLPSINGIYYVLGAGLFVVMGVGLYLILRKK